MKIKYSLLFLLLALLLQGCFERKEKQTKKEKQKYEGQTIMVIVPKLHADLVRGAILKEAEVFEKMTGANIKVVTPNWNETINTINESINGNKDLFFDMYIVVGLWNGTLLSKENMIAKVPKWVKEKLEWEDVLPIYKNNILTWNNVTYGLPYDGDSITMYYRKDIFENSNIKQKYKKLYSKDLNPPRTWEEYIQISKFFTGWDWDNDGKIEYGNAGLRIKGDVSLLQFFAFAGAYAKHPQNKGYYFDPATMKAQIANEAFVKALDDYIELIEYGPQGMENFAGHDVRNSFVTGEVALAIDWADLGIYSANSENSIVRDKIGFDILPGRNSVYNYKTKKWDAIFNNPSSISGNWVIFVNKNSKYKELAFDFAAHVGSKKTTKKYIVDPGSAVNPSRYSHFEDAKSWENAGFLEDRAREYLDTLEKSLENKNVAVDIMIPGGELYYKALDKYLYEAILGNLSSKEALSKAAMEWEKITDDLGREKQKEYYKSSLNMR